MHGRTPATACPVMMACVYSLLPKPGAYAKRPFCISPVAMLAEKTIRSMKPKYRPAGVLNKVEMARSVKQMMLIVSDDRIRLGYEAFFCIF